MKKERVEFIDNRPGDAEIRLCRLFRERQNYNIHYTLPFNTLLLILDEGDRSSGFENVRTGEVCVPKTGDVLLVPAMLPVLSRPRDSMWYLAVHYNLELLPGCDVFDGEDRFFRENLPAETIAMNRVFDAGNRIETLFRFQQFLLNFSLRHWPDDCERKVLRMGPFTPVLNYIRENVNAKMNVAELADFFGETPASFSRKFHRALGMSPKNFLDKELLNKIQPLFNREMLKVRDIAAQMNFASEAYFSTFFKRLTGISPEEYRRMIIKSKF